MLQENIQLAKRDWELSHLQTMREEEEKMAEEEAADESPLTYDRPDLCNKVTLRRSSTGMWEVCSSGQNAENENGVLGFPKKRKMSERPAKKVELGDSENMEHDSNKRTLRSAHCETQVDSISTSGNAKVQGGHRNDSSVKHQCASRSSLKACAKDFSVVVTLPSIPVIKRSPDVLAGGNESSSPSAKPVKNCNKFHSDCSNTDDDGTLLVDCSESLTNSVSPVNHKYATRQKVALHNSK